MSNQIFICFYDMNIYIYICITNGGSWHSMGTRPKVRPLGFATNPHRALFKRTWQWHMMMTNNSYICTYSRETLPLKRALSVTFTYLFPRDPCIGSLNIVIHTRSPDVGRKWGGEGWGSVSADTLALWPASRGELDRGSGNLLRPAVSPSWEIVAGALETA